MNRIEMRNYYRKCAGYLGMMGAILMFTLSCLAIYISDFSEINGVEEGTGVVMLNCLYLIFTVGMSIWSWESCWFFSALQISCIAAMANSTMTGEAIWQRMYRR